MEYLKAEESDFNAVVELWQQVFEDSTEEIVEMLHNFVGYKNQYVARENGRVVAILSAVPCYCEALSGVYFFALATQREMRGRGIMAGLMQYAEGSVKQSGAHFTVLIPASEPLFGYYSKVGYTGNINLRSFDWHAGKSSPKNKTVLLSTKKLSDLRQKMLKQSVVSFNKNSTQIIYNDLEAVPVSLYSSRYAYAVVYNLHEGVRVGELAAENDSHAMDLLDFICAEFNVAQLAVDIPFSSELFEEETVVKKYALVKSLLPEKEEKSMYLRFALDDILV